MKKHKIVEWTCDRCGKTCLTRRFEYPLDIHKLKMECDLNQIKGHYFGYKKNLDLCTDCLEDFMQRYFEWMDEQKRDEE